MCPITYDTCRPYNLRLCHTKTFPSFFPWQHFPPSPPTFPLPAYSELTLRTEWVKQLLIHPQCHAPSGPCPVLLVCLGLSCKVFKFRVVFGIRNTENFGVTSPFSTGCACLFYLQIFKFLFHSFSYFACTPRDSFPFPAFPFSYPHCVNIIIVKVKAVTLGYLYKSLNSVPHALFLPSLPLPLLLSPSFSLL